jgi:hypothetical protein
VAVLALGDRGHEAGRDDRLLLRQLDERAEDGGAVDDRIGVRHGEDRAVAARRSRSRAARDGLLVLAAGSAQVDVRVDERRREHEAGRFDHLVLVGVEARPELRDRAGVDADVDGAVRPLGGVDHARAADDDVRRRGLLLEEHQATSWMCATLATLTGPCVSRS